SWQSAEGLPDNSVSGVAQTPDGYLWVATAGGLMRFDGVRFQEFPLVRLEGVPNGVVRAMFMDSHGRLWLGMDRGPVVCVATNSAQVFTNLPDVRATFIAEDGASEIWITYADGELVRIAGGRAEMVNTIEGWPAAGTSSLAEDNNGRLWFARGRQVGLFREGRFQTLLTTTDNVWCISRRIDGGVWICAGRRLITCNIKGESKFFGELPASPNGIEATALLEDHSGAVWVGTAASGLYRCDGTNTVSAPTSHHEITCLMQDTEDDLWVGTGGGGLDRLRPRLIEFIGMESGLPYESVRSVCADHSGAIWVTMQNGLLARWQNRAWTVLPRTTNGPRGFFSCVAADRQDDGLWIGTRDRGLFHWANGRCQNWRQRDGLSSDDVRAILVSSSGDVYVASDSPSRLQRIAGGRLKALKMALQPRSIRALAEDAKGRVWAGSADGRLLLVDGDRLVDETPDANKRLLSIRCLHATPDGSLWIGYAGWGIGWLKNGQYARISSDEGLYDDYVSQMAADRRGWLWCAGNRGIFEVPLDQLLAVATGKQARLRSVAYSRGEGFPNLQPNYENVPGVLQTADGRIWFPMHTGIAVIHPDRVPTAGTPTPVVLERVAVDGKIVGTYHRYFSPGLVDAPDRADLEVSGATLHLPPSLRKLDVAFTALSFMASENVDFQYRLQGLDDNWTENGTLRSASFSRLPPGNYAFQVRACSLAGTWTSPPASLQLIVAPFYWQTWWFRILAVFLFTIVIIAVVRYVSFRRLRRQLVVLE
ncbi:MAG TPA: two-component regulator propeller domain-containing protein, partial [Verrucomicrobiae bacterium]|nr:two-component regulator propeller domain-containing protein [Verrucomicrobiae bacterium]